VNADESIDVCETPVATQPGRTGTAPDSMMPRLSVIIPTFRRPAFLREALGSVENARATASLSPDEIEVVVIDDGHDHLVQDICEERSGEWSIPVRYQQSAQGPGAGPSRCRDQGIRAARGELIHLLDDDDTFLPPRFANSVRLLTTGGFDAVFEPSLRAFMDEPSRPSFITGPYGSHERPFEFLLSGGPRSHITPAATSFRKSIYERCGGYDEDLRYGEDGEFLLRLCLYGRVALVDGAPVATISIHGANTSRPANIAHWQNVKSLACLHRKLRNSRWPEEAALIRNALATKLDFALTECRRKAPTYRQRLLQGARALRYYDWRCLTVQNVKSIAVWVTKGRLT
jgi:glycosyltransferase involved in cell wall biosynthesis